jgi:ribosomal protein S18 acetylase RimI-like enzyme
VSAFPPYTKSRKNVLLVSWFPVFVADHSRRVTVLDNPAWSALTTHQAHLALGGDHARRFPPHLAPIAALGRPDRAALEELATLVPDGGSVSLPATLESVVPLLPPQLAITLEKRLVQMVCETPVDVAAASTLGRGRSAFAVDLGGPAVTRRGSRDGPEPPMKIELSVLSEADIPDMLELTTITHPGPFRSHTYTLGTYLGIRIAGRLAAMGGQRMHVPGYRELSAICTHPDFQGRGYARTIVARLMAETFERGLIPFLHVEEANRRAQAVYRDLGFVERARLPLLVVERKRAGTA